ncbi:S-layer homology domain-containing protein [Paenibacillus sp. GCM10012306]|uniref:S-layer homology domain-containing protein n=1 Tax=Paenibacillus sp. GCM10012306 TaxID=3317342 RepID=UPI00360A197E
MAIKFKPKKIVSLLLAASLAVLPLQAGRAAAAETTVSTAATPLSTFDYFSKVYPKLNDPNHVYKTATYEDIVHLFETQGTYAVLVGGSWDENTQADIGFINEVAKDYGISTIYNFDTKLDGDTLQIADTNNKFAYKYVDLVNKYLTNLNVYDKNDPAHNVSYTAKNGSTVSANKIEAPFLFVYNKDNKDAQGNSAPIVSYLNDSKSWSQFQTNGTLDQTKVNAYKDQVRSVFAKAVKYDTINESEYIKAAFNKNYEGENPGKPTIFTQADGDLVYEHVTYHQLKEILSSDGNYAFLFGGSWCPNTQAVIKYINEQAKKNNIKKIYLWDTKLDSGVTVGVPNNNSGNSSKDGNPHTNNELQVRDTKHSYAKLYVDLVNNYLTNIKTQDNTATPPNTISYVDQNGTQIYGDRLQVPYFFTYSKNNKDDNGQPAPILGHIELMYSWTNIQPDNISNGYAIGARYGFYLNALDKIFSRLEAIPTELSAVAPTSTTANDGQITGVLNKSLEYKRADEADYKPVSGEAITGLAPGTYQVRYASKPGYQGPTNAAGATAIPYKPGQAIEIVVPAFTHQQAAPTELIGVAPTTPANNDGQITGTNSALEYKPAAAADYIPVTGEAITGLVPGFYEVRYAAKEGYSASPVTRVEVPAYGEQAAPTGLVGIAPTSPANNDGRITGTTPALEYKLAGVTDYVYATDVQITGLVPGTYNVRYAAKEGFKAGRAADVIVPAYTAEQAAPTGLTGIAPTSSANNDGRITGTTPALEYKLSTVTNYVYATDVEITGLVPGTYNVRYAAKEGYKESPVTDVVVPEYKAPTGGGDTGPSTGSNSPAPTPVSSPAPTASAAPVTSAQGNTIIASKTAVATTDESTGVTTASITAADVTELVESAKKAEADGKSALLEIKVETTAKTQTAELTIPRSAFNAVASGTKAQVKINYANVGTITLDAKAIANISGAKDEGDIHIRIAKVSLTDEGKAVLGDRPVYDLSVKAGELAVASFGGGKVQISVPYKLQAGEEPNSIIIYHINESGSLDNVRGKYAAGTVDFVTTHFSQYIVAYNKVDFADVAATAWYNDAVSFLAARSITSGTDDSHYSPNASVTRGQFTVLLLKAYGIDADENAADNFADAGNTYYTGYLAAAKRLGITTGVGENQFKPDSKITRQELFTLLYRSLDVLGELPASKNGPALSSYSDASQIADYAKEALQALTASGVIAGNNGKLNPGSVSTRAEVAQVLFNLLSK